MEEPIFTHFLGEVGKGWNSGLRISD